MHEPLELLIDLGLEKLHNDYMRLLRRANFLNVQEIRQKLGNVSSGEFNIEKYRYVYENINKISNVPTL